jgi:glycosyltransferase involved in cell wall biosynthesis
MSVKYSDPEVIVSVLLSVYNCEKYLSEAIDSVLVQTFTDWELILINDCSTDSSGEIANVYAAKDQRIRYFSMNNNSGLATCLNFGISQAIGKYIARLDADDIMKPERLEKQVAFMEEHLEMGIVGSSVESIDENGNFIANLNVETEPQKLKKLLPIKNPFFHPSIMMRVSFLREVGEYSSQYPYAEDYDMWIRFAQISSVGNIPLTLTKYRVLTTSVSRKSLRYQSRDVVKLKLSAIIQGYHSLFDIIYIVRPLVYWFSPNWLLQKRFEYQMARAKKQKNFSYR